MAISKERLRNACLTEKRCGLASELGTATAKNRSALAVTHYKSLGTTWRPARLNYHFTSGNRNETAWPQILSSETLLQEDQ